MSESLANPVTKSKPYPNFDSNRNPNHTNPNKGHVELRYYGYINLNLFCGMFVNH